MGCSHCLLKKKKEEEEEDARKEGRPGARSIWEAQWRGSHSAEMSAGLS